MMAVKCNPKLSHPMYGYGKQEKSNFIIARVSEGINYLTEKSTGKYYQITKGTLGTFDPTTLPQDLIRCNEVKCHMTGTLWVKPNGGSIRVKYRIKGDYTAAAFGLNYIYINYLGTDALNVTAKVSDYEDIEQVNSYAYTDKVQNRTASVTDFVIAQFDFADPTKIQHQTGTGWTPSQRGITVEYTITHANNNDAYINEEIGISSIKTICSRDELHKADNVLLSCLTSFAPNTSVDATDARCFGSGYDPDSVSVEWSLEATTRSHNDFWLNPLERKGDQYVTGIPTTREFVVGTKVVDGTTFGYLELADLYSGCNSVIVSIGDDCQGYYLEPLQTPRITEVDRQEFITLYNANDDFGGTYLHKDHIGKTVLVTYDAETEVTHYIADDEKMKSFEAEFIVPQTGATNNKIEYYKFYAIITEHSEEFNVTDEVSLSLSLQLVRRNGRFYDRYVVES